MQSRPILIALVLVTFASVGGRAAGPMTIFDFSEERAAADWVSINDTVMGGVSVGRLEATDEGTVAFTGNVSLENNGGFASVRSRPREWDLREFSGLLLHVRGDGSRYKINLKQDANFDGVLYRAAFDTVAGEWRTIRLRFEEFVPTFRGRLVRDAPPLDPAQVVSFGLMISDKQAGPFRLELARIEGFGD